MDHAHHMDMDHGHGGHADMSMPMRCNMNMLFTWDTTNLCIVFRSWRISNTFTLFLSLFLIVVLCAGYEAVREVSRKYEAACASRLQTAPRSSRPQAERSSEIIKATLYAVQVFYSFFIMLLFMTYNGWVMIAVAVGAFVGHLVFGKDTTATKSVACH